MSAPSTPTDTGTANVKTTITDIAIVGGGFAGTMAAIVLANAGHKVTLVDVSDKFPNLFRAEKFRAIRSAFLKNAGFMIYINPSWSLSKAISIFAAALSSTTRLLMNFA